jgi:hypothetical protein
MLEQTVKANVGQIVVIDLPSLPIDQAVDVTFDPSVLDPLPGQNLYSPQNGGWYFKVSRIGTSVLTVRSVTCNNTNNTTSSSDSCEPSLWFRVTITAQ